MVFNKLCLWGWPIVRWTAVLVGVLVINGCSIGPTALKENHTTYNQAVRQVINEEILLNIVRKRYGDATQYLSVASITSQFTFDASFSGNAAFAPGATTGGTGLGLAYGDAPTLSLIPRSGEQIAQQLLSPINVRNIAYLGTLGFGPNLALTMLSSNLNGVRGLEWRLDSEWIGEQSEFGRLVELLNELGNDVDIGFVRVFDSYMPKTVSGNALRPNDLVSAVQTDSHWRSKDGGKTYNLTRQDLSPVLWISEKGKASPAGREFMSMLSLDPAVPNYLIVKTEELNRPTKLMDRIFVETRSFESVLHAVSLGVKEPDDHVEDRILKVPSEQSTGSGFRKFLRQRFTVNTSDSSPDHAAVAVQYRDHWFYIDDRDHRSKAAFTFIANLFDLQVKSPSKEAEPVLTLPVGG